MKWHNPFFFFVIVRMSRSRERSVAGSDVTISSFSFIKTRIKQEASNNEEYESNNKNE